MVSVALVPPRYGVDIVGGAELGARLLAEHLVAAGHRAEVFTSCAREATTWADVVDPGTTVENDVTVHRFRSRSGRAADFDTWGLPVMADPSRRPRAVVDEWLRRQGPHNPDMVEAAVAGGADAVVGYPYLYWPTVELVRAAPSRAVVHPAAHDEVPLRLPVFGEIMRRCRGLVWHTDAERDVVESVHRVGSVPQLTLGLGVDIGTGSADAARAAFGLDDRPVVVCIGRVDPGKGVDLLVELFAAYKQRRPGPLTLVLVGPVNVAPPPHPEVVLAGSVDEATKWGLLDAASVLVSPSPNESFSFVLLEAFLASRPAMVNARCAATTEHARRSGAAVPFDDYVTFEVGLDRLLGDAELSAAMGERGRRYVDEHFRWPRVIDRYVRFLERVVG